MEHTVIAVDPAKLNHRLPDLPNFVFMKGTCGYNPWRDVDRFMQPDREIDAIDFAWVQKILAALPTEDVNAAIVPCLACTGMRPSPAWAVLVGAARQS